MRRLLTLVSTIVFVDALLFGTLIPLVPGYVDDFGLSKLQAGLLVSAFGAGALLGGLPGGLVAGRVGPKRAVVVGLLLLSLASAGFALAETPWTLGIARFVQGLSSTLTWSGALAWLTVSVPRARRGQILGTVFGIAVLGAILGPMFGAVAQTVGIRGSFAGVTVVALVLAAVAAAHAPAPGEHVAGGALRRALSDGGFHVGLWLNLLAAFFFGVLDVLVPLALHAGDYGTLAIGAVFLAAGIVEAGANPVVGRISDRRGRLLPVRAALIGSAVFATLLALAGSPTTIVVLTIVGSVSFGGFYTPGMALVSDRAERAGLAQGLAFGIMNTGWALGALLGPSVGGGLADVFGDAAAYALCAALSAATLAAITLAVRTRGGAESARESTARRAGVGGSRGR